MNEEIPHLNMLRVRVLDMIFGYIDCISYEI